MKVVGLTGGIGCGKTTVAGILETHFSMKVIYADEIAKEHMEKGGISYEGVVKEFGSEILLIDGEIDRKKLSEIIFSDINARKKLNDLTHPQVTKVILDEIKELKEFGAFKGVFIETALLIEAGYKEYCDEVWYIHATEEERKNRLIKSRNFSEEKVRKVIENQICEEEFFNNADKVIENGDQVTVKDIMEQILSYVEDWEEDC